MAIPFGTHLGPYEIVSPIGAALAAGTRLGAYEIVALVGSGGMQRTGLN